MLTLLFNCQSTETRIYFDNYNQATLKLGKDQTATIKGIPASWHITVQETGAASYTTTYAVDGGTAVKGKSATISSGNTAAAVVFTNTRISSPPTGITMGQSPILLLGMTIFAFGLIVVAIIVKRYFFCKIQIKTMKKKI